jgi:hypothetical protein
VSVHLPPDAIRVLVDDTEVAGEETPAAASGRQEGELAQR